MCILKHKSRSKKIAGSIAQLAGQCHWTRDDLGRPAAAPSTTGFPLTCTLDLLRLCSHNPPLHLECSSLSQGHSTFGSCKKRDLSWSFFPGRRPLLNSFISTLLQCKSQRSFSRTVRISTGGPATGHDTDSHQDRPIHAHKADQSITNGGRHCYKQLAFQRFTTHEVLEHR